MHLSMSSPGGGDPQEFDCDAYPQGGDFDRASCINLIFQFREKRSKPFVSANFENYFLPGGGDFAILFQKCQNPHATPGPHLLLPHPPSPVRIDIDIGA